MAISPTSPVGNGVPSGPTTPHLNPASGVPIDPGLAAPVRVVVGGQRGSLGQAVGLQDGASEGLLDGVIPHYVVLVWL
jgi:hypothetical protein